MSAIKLPVKVVSRGDVFVVFEPDGKQVSTTLRHESEAKQIAVALNLHDDLVAELVRLKDVVGKHDFEIIRNLLERTGQ